MILIFNGSNVEIARYALPQGLSTEAEALFAERRKALRGGSSYQIFR